MTGLGIGEAYYFKGVHALDWSYFDQPPLFFWLSAFTTHLFGDNALALRIPAILLFAGTSWLLFRIAYKVYSAKAGWYAVLLLNISPVFTIPVAMWFQPDAPLMFFWMLTLYYVVRIFFNQPNEAEAGVNHQDTIRLYRSSKKVYILWIMVGIALGLTTLSKYHSALLLAGTVLFCLFNKSYRHWLWHPGPYLAIIINVLISLPIFIWNYQNEWISFLFQGARAGADEGLRLYPHFLLRSILGQAIWLAPWIWVPMCIAAFQAFKNRKSDIIGAFFVWLSILPIAIFTLIALWTDTLFHFHWQAPGYLMLFMVLGNRVAKRLENPVLVPKIKRWIRISGVSMVLLAGILLLHAEMGIGRSLIPDEFLTENFEGRDPTVEGTDYEEIGELFVEKGWLEQDSLFVGSTRWWQAGKVDWALRGELPLIIFHFDPRNHAYFVNPNDLIGYDAVLVTQHDESVVGYFVRRFFEDMEYVEKLEIKRSGKTEIVMHVYYCRNFQQASKSTLDMPLIRQLNGKSPF